MHGNGSIVRIFSWEAGHCLGAVTVVARPIVTAKKAIRTAALSVPSGNEDETMKRQEIPLLAPHRGGCQRG